MLGGLLLRVKKIIFICFVLVIMSINIVIADNTIGEYPLNYYIILNDDQLDKNIKAVIQEKNIYIPLLQLKKNLNIQVTEDKIRGNFYIEWQGNVLICNKDTELVTLLNNQIITRERPIFVNEQPCFPISFFEKAGLGQVSIIKQIRSVRIITNNTAMSEEKVIEKINVLNEKKQNGRIAYLTFDDGLDKNITAKVVDILDAYNIKGTFFIVGNTINSNKELLKRLVSEGHSVGNHSYTHRKESVYGSTKSFSQELKKTRDLIFKETGKNVRLFRPPYGMNFIYNNDFKSVLTEYKVAAWNVDGLDAKEKGIKSDKIASSIISQVKKRKSAVVLMHCSSTHIETVKALPEIIEYLQDNYYSIRIINDNSDVSYSFR